MDGGWVGGVLGGGWWGGEWEVLVVGGVAGLVLVGLLGGLGWVVGGWFGW